MTAYSVGKQPNRFFSLSSWCLIFCIYIFILFKMTPIFGLERQIFKDNKDNSSLAKYIDDSKLPHISVSFGYGGTTKEGVNYDGRKEIALDDNSIWNLGSFLIYDKSNYESYWVLLGRIDKNEKYIIEIVNSWSKNLASQKFKNSYKLFQEFVINMCRGNLVRDVGDVENQLKFELPEKQNKFLKQLFKKSRNTKDKDTSVFFVYKDRVVYSFRTSFKGGSPEMKDIQNIWEYKQN